MSVRQVPRKKGCWASNKARRPQRQLMSLSLRKTHIMNLCILELTNIHGFKRSIFLNIYLAKECSSNLWLSLTTDIKTLISIWNWAWPHFICWDCATGEWRKGNHRLFILIPTYFYCFQIWESFLKHSGSFLWKMLSSFFLPSTFLPQFF